MRRRPPRPTNRSEWAGPVAFILALGLSVGWAVAMITLALPITGPYNDQAVQLLTTIGGVIAGAVSAYLGAHFFPGTVQEPPETPPWPPAPPRSDELTWTEPPDESPGGRDVESKP